MTAPSKPKILVVDDEPQILEGLKRSLRGTFEVISATSGALGLEALATSPDVAIVLSDMRMPVMNGTAFLTHARATTPNAVRLLLTGQADMEDAIGAINDGRIFRFLKKPCPPEQLRSALDDALAQHRLIIAERELLEQTLRGAVKALCDTLALANPRVFGMATRVKRIAARLAESVGGVELWQIEVAAMLCQLGAVTLPPGIYERAAIGDVPAAERAMLDRVPEITDQLLAPIPRLDAVRAIVTRSRESFDGPKALAHPLPPGACVLRIALDFEMLESAGLGPRAAVERLRERTGRYDPAFLDALARLYEERTAGAVEIPIGRLLEGMVLAADVFTKSGIMLVARGHEVTPGLLRRLENFDPSLREDKVAVVMDADHRPLRRDVA